MDRKTLLAVVISVVVIVGGMLLQSVIFPPKPPSAQVAQQPAAQATPQPAPSEASPPAASESPGAAPAAPTGKVVPAAPPAGSPEPTVATIARETDIYALNFSTAGGTLASVKLRKYKNLDGSPVDMILLPKNDARGVLPFAISFGDSKAAQVDVPFALRETSDSTQSTFEFSRVFLSPSGIPFTLRKTYVFFKDEYLFELRVSIENSVNDFPALDFGGYAYTLTLGPQIGPHYLKLDGRSDFRNYAYYADGKRQDPKAGMGSKIGWFMALEEETDLVGADEAELTNYINLAESIGAKEKEVAASRELLKRFPMSAKAKEAKETVQQYEKLAPLRQKK